MRAVDLVQTYPAVALARIRSPLAAVVGEERPGAITLLDRVLPA